MTAPTIRVATHREKQAELSWPAADAPRVVVPYSDGRVAALVRLRVKHVQGQEPRINGSVGLYEKKDGRVGKQSANLAFWGLEDLPADIAQMARDALKGVSW